MQQAIDYEVRWQIDQIEDGHTIQQATVLFDPDTGETRAMRTRKMRPTTATSPIPTCRRW
jgi:aspartyl-tRNA(Asn)/glutamyl-tRNA(Gln) amidotransferase subunit B